MRYASNLTRHAIACAMFAAAGLSLPTTSMAQAPAAKTDKPAAPAPVSSEPAVTTATYGNWVLRCLRIEADAKQTKQCEIVQTIQVEGQSQPVAQIALGRLPGEAALHITAVLPVNVSLPGNVHVSGNGKDGTDEKGGLDLQWRRCAGGACYADGQPADDVLKIWRKEPQAQLRFIDAAGRTIGLPLSWNGLPQALDALARG
ncbi:invasion associated locus B family protein [Rhizobium sp. SGZ-381]|uniref:invasion associated locus B family protein n=1 Tax=Rhizobium sp. SGZ-381 TaxID=3342800 RepID=UPI00366BE8D7